MIPKRPLVITLILLTLVIILTSNLANATEQAVISFNNAKHRAALIDSLLAVHDTTWEGWWPCFTSDTSAIGFSDWLQNVKRLEKATNQPDTCYIYLFRPIVTRRELVRIKIMPGALNIVEYGKATIVWKKVFTTFGEYDPLRGKDK